MSPFWVRKLNIKTLAILYGEMVQTELQNCYLSEEHFHYYLIRRASLKKNFAALFAEEVVISMQPKMCGNKMKEYEGK